MIATEARFGSTIALAGYLLDPPGLVQQAGEPLRLTLVWRCDRPPPLGARFFTHVTDASGRLLLNLDEAGPLRAAPQPSPNTRRDADTTAPPPLPPWRCRAGGYLLDPVTVPLDASLPETVHIRVGLYRGERRLPAEGGAVDAAQQAAVIKLRLRGGTGTAGTPPVPQLTVTRIEAGQAPVIDGVLDDPVWQHAARTAAFVHAGNGRPQRQPPRGSARLSYDERNLYVALEVEDHTLRGGFDPAAVDPPLWTRDTAEIMIDPDGDGDNRDYYEIQINPQNLIFDSHFDHYNAPRGGPNGPFGHQAWRANARSAVALRGSLDDDSDRDGGYVVEAAIPWRAFHKARHVPPRPGDTWRMNFYAMQDNGGAAWSPILGRGNFHRASRFGRVTFR